VPPSLTVKTANYVRTIYLPFPYYSCHKKRIFRWKTHWFVFLMQAQYVPSRYEIEFMKATVQINFSLSLFKKFKSFRATYQSTYPDYFSRKSSLANTNINFCALLSHMLIFPTWCLLCTFSDQTFVFCHAPYKPHIIQFHFWLPSFKHIYPPVGWFFFYLYLSFSMWDDISTRQLHSNTFSCLHCDFAYGWSRQSNNTFPHFGDVLCPCSLWSKDETNLLFYTR